MSFDPDTTERARRGRRIIELMQKLSAPYGTTMVDKGWYAEVKLP